MAGMSTMAAATSIRANMTFPSKRSTLSTSCAGLTRASILFVRRWIASNLGLARVSQGLAAQVGYTRLVLSSPAMTTDGVYTPPHRTCAADVLAHGLHARRH